MKTSEALSIILSNPDKALPPGIENEVSTNIPLAIAVSARAIVVSINKLEQTISKLDATIEEAGNKIAEMAQ